MAKPVQKAEIVKQLKKNRSSCYCGFGLVVKENKSKQKQLHCEECGNVFPFYEE